MLHLVWEFQCSSASRKFLNTDGGAAALPRPPVSVLFSEPKIPQSNGRACERLASARFQCSSASRKFLNAASSASPRRSPAVSVLFSEPKIPQFRGDGGADRVNEVSVLFSEPKIPQLSDPSLARLLTSTFQCSSASRKFLNRTSATTKSA